MEVILLKKITIIKSFRCLTDLEGRKNNHFIMLDDSLLYGTDMALSIEERMLLYAILLIALKQKSLQISVDFEHLKGKLAIISNIYDVLSSLKDNEIIMLGYRQKTSNKEVSKEVSKEVDLVIPISTSSREVTNSFNLEALYQLFPRKEGKASGMKKLTKIVKNQNIYDEILTGIKNYSKSKSGTEKKFIRKFNNFIEGEEWKDFLTEAKESTSEEEFFNKLQIIADGGVI